MVLYINCKHIFLNCEKLQYSSAFSFLMLCHYRTDSMCGTVVYSWNLCARH